MSVEEVDRVAVSSHLSTYCLSAVTGSDRMLNMLNFIHVLQYAAAMWHTTHSPPRTSAYAAGDPSPAASANLCSAPSVHYRTGLLAAMQHLATTKFNATN